MATKINSAAVLAAITASCAGSVRRRHRRRSLLGDGAYLQCRIRAVVIGTLLCSVANPRLVVGQPCAYVANLMSDSVSVIDTATNVVTATVAVGRNPSGIGLNSGGGPMCVTNFGSNDVSLVSPSLNLEVARVPVGAGPVGVVRTPGGAFPGFFAYVANKNDSSVSVIQTETKQVIATIAVDPVPEGVAIGPLQPTVYVTHSSQAGSVSVIDIPTNTVTAKIPVGARPGRVAFTPDGRFAYVTNFGSFNVSVIDTATNAVTATVGLSLKPSDVDVTPDGQSAYVTNFGAPIVSIIPVATNMVIEAITVGAQPAAIAHIRNRGHGYTYVANSGSDTVSVIDRANDNQVVATIPVGHVPFALAVGAGACAALPTATPTTTQTQTATRSLTPVPTHTATASPVSTATATSTAIPTSTATPTPTPTPTLSHNPGGGCALDCTIATSGNLLWLILGVAMLARRRCSAGA